MIRGCIRGAAVTFAMVALLLSACGSGDIDGSSSANPSVSPRPGTHVWVVSPFNSVRGSPDGGATWSVSHPFALAADDASADVFLRAIAFSDDRHGWVAGAYGVIAATADGGATWQGQQSGTTQLLSDLCFTDAAHGWAIGQAGTILATSDGGLTWEAQQSGSEATLRGVAFVDQRRGWVAGFEEQTGASVILSTRDGGQSWQVIHRARQVELYDIAAPDAEHLWAVGDDLAAQKGVIIASGDGGRRWTTQLTTSPTNDTGRPYLAYLSFADASSGWAVGLDNLILATRDGGSSWVEQHSGLDQVRFSGAACTDSRSAWLVGNAGPESFLGCTMDGGASWAMVRFDTGGNGFMGIDCFAPRG